MDLDADVMLILQHDNASAHNAKVVKNTIKDLGWELLPHVVLTRLSAVGLPPFHIFRTRLKKPGIFELRHFLKMACWLEASGTKFWSKRCSLHHSDEGQQPETSSRLAFLNSSRNWVGQISQNKLNKRLVY
ncbi:TMEM62 [Cordylochernes scorpioides]|uniref:TMEM62 n=1 Tax=Cordylochernes scorpioides TaxID=51811 RepID=A0ABY6LWU9_9ARAC|nr:TMEM62 [Cordylochernes scorpioides]